ncbi:hypothetical protein H9639_12230 [Arthrobacter sp. Sa2CUA1]|uniref:Polysaccharide biosynthesis protein C-terminal domain-containing protein n=1 Tax=Arthrobacter gallicola TaxID=2762225 RepID=A0ABR8UU41_9MICC|nr:hypothetical protein [Arthrobacter gallicola]MBD7996067.1 hypothetical protein [Arthrobacter gallicola]
MTTNTLFVAMSSVGLPLSALIGGPTFVAFAVIDKVQKQLTTVALPLTQLITGKMAGDLSRGVGRVATATGMFRSVIISACGLTLLMLPLGPLAVRMMSVGLVEVSAAQTVALALLVGLAFAAQCLPVAVLAPLDRLKYGVWGMVLGLVLGSPLIYFVGRSLGITFVMVTISGMYLLTIGFCIAGLANAKRNERDVLSL